MKPVLKPEVAIDDILSLNSFYCLTHKLSNTRRVKFLGKEDDPDNIDWNFKYRGRKLTLQYNIYNGVSLFSNNSSDASIVMELAGSLQKKDQ